MCVKILIAEDEPLPVGHYIDSGARLKVRVEVAHPITTPQEVHEKPEMDTPIEVNSAPTSTWSPILSIMHIAQLGALADRMMRDSRGHAASWAFGTDFFATQLQGQ